MNSQQNRKLKASSARRTRVHAGEERGVERQDALRRRLVPAIAERVKARRRTAELDDDAERRRRARRCENARRAKAAPMAR